MEKEGFGINADVNHGLLYMSIAGCILAYISMVYNLIILLVLCSRRLRSPTSVLMQALAIADFLAGFLSYGFEPVFQVSYVTVNKNSDSSLLTLMYPYCALYVYVSQFADTFHLSSVLLTTCLGIQKVLALKFPIWFRNNLKINSTVIGCFLCYIISFAINIPRHFAVSFESRKNVSFGYFNELTTEYETQQLNDACLPIRNSRNAFIYATRYYSLVFAVLLVFLSAIMCLCVFYTVYKLCHRTFRKKNTIRRNRERRSIIMITVVLVIFLVSEIPRLGIYSYVFFGQYLDIMLNYETSEDLLEWIVTDYRGTLAMSLKFYFDFGFGNLLLIVESVKLIGIIGCMSNFIIYFTMYKQLRHELKQACLKSFKNR